MLPKNKKLVLVFSLFTTILLLAGGFWWFTKQSNQNINKISNSQSSDSQPSQETLNQQQPNKNITKKFTAVKNVPTGLFNYGGSTSWAPFRLAVDSIIQAQRPEFRLRYVQPKNANPGSSTGIESLINGQLTFAQSSRPVTDAELNRAQQKGFQLRQIPVAIDGLAIAVNPNLNIPGLTIEQLKSIYTGKIKNWQEVGGEKLPIKAFTRRISDGGTVELFVQDILGGQSFGPQVEFVSTTTQALRKVANIPGSIYYASAPEIVPQCSIKPLPLGHQQGKYVAPYQEPLILHINVLISVLN